MTSPWSGLDAATGQKKLYLDPAVIPEVNQAFTPYEASLQQLIDDELDETTGYFGTDENPLAKLLEKAFNARGQVLTDYLKEQLSQAQDFVKTARDAAAAMQAHEKQ
jgi:hypothetical protein